jgi:hypothetical protein
MLLEQSPSKNQLAILVKQDQEWLFRDRPMDLNLLTDAYITPAVSGIPMVDGLSERDYQKALNYYSMYSYRKFGPRGMSDKFDPYQAAMEMGFTKIIEFQANGKVLSKKEFLLN